VTHDLSLGIAFSNPVLKIKVMSTPIAENCQAVIVVVHDAQDTKPAAESSPNLEPGCEVIVTPEKPQVQPSKEQGKSEWLNDLVLLLIAILMGLWFGVAMERGKVTPPLTIRKQFLFQRFVMIKMFITAACSGAICFSIMCMVLPAQFDPVRAKFMSSRAKHGLLPVIVGTFLLGCGMAVAGACPGMVYIQLGAGIDNAWITLLGGMAGAISYGLVHPLLSRFLGVGRCETTHKLDDLAPLRGVAYWKLGLPLAAAMVVAAALFEHFFPWNSDSELAARGPVVYKQWSEAWAPELSGGLIGLLQVCYVM
jgi:uncharacterized membrane protein YedE/YeeE